MAKQSPFLQRRGDAFGFRIAVPADLRPYVGHREFTRALGTSDKREAVPLALAMAARAKAPKALRTLLISRVGREWTQAVSDRYRDAGSHALHKVNAADTGKNAAYEALNREMRRALVNILRTRP